MKKSVDLLKILYKNKTWCSLAFLAETFHVSIKTIKNYKTSINKSFDGEIVISSKRGYRFNDEYTTDFRNMLERKEGKSTFTSLQRVSYLLQQLIKNETVNLYDIADELFVSIPTIEKDLKEARKTAYNNEVEIQKKGEFISLIGTEASLRKLTKRVIQKEAAYDFLSIQFIQEMIENIDVAQINTILTQNIKSTSFYINGYTINSILLHLSISMNRFLSNSRIIENSNSEVDKSLPEYTLAENIIRDLNGYFQIRLDNFEIINLYVLLMSKVSSNSKNVLKDFLNGDVYEFISNSLIAIQKKYRLEEFSKDIHLKLALHCQNLIQRALQGKMIVNPLTKKIKSDYPFLFDISVDLSQKINHRYNIRMTEDEITFITFHLGSYFEEINKLNYKLKTILVAPKYYDMNQALYKNIQQDLEREISISSVIETYGIVSKSQKEQYDLVITTIKNDLPSNGVLISPFYSNNDRVLIFNKIQQVQKSKKLAETRKLINHYFKPDLFEKEVYFNSSDAYIKYMCERLYALGYVNENFVEHVLSREHISSTAFNDFIAIPHSGELNANKTGIYIISNKQKIQWGYHSINTIMLICTSIYDSTKFKSMMDLLVSLYSNTENTEKIQDLLSASTFHEYLENIINIT